MRFQVGDIGFEPDHLVNLSSVNLWGNLDGLNGSLWLVLLSVKGH